jgi:hypothetical protein
VILEADKEYVIRFMAKDARRREMDKEIIEKVRKLRALATSSEPHEAVLAFVNAEALMKEHGISEGNPQIGAFPFPTNRWGKPMFPVSPYPLCKDVEPGKWTRFMDMSSGGGQKLPWHYIYIEAPEAEARVIFYNRFDRDPDCVTCTCCGEDYSVSESESLGEATAYDRGCKTVCVANPEARFPDIGDEEWVEAAGDSEWDRKRFMSLADYLTKHNRPELAEKQESRALARREDRDREACLIIRAADIKPEERKGEVHRSGYVWQD